MKYSRQIIAHLFVAACLAPKFAAAQSDCDAAPGSCNYNDVEKHSLLGSSSALPPSVKETLEEMKMQQNNSSRSNDDKVASFSFVLGTNQDPDYMKAQIKTFLSSLNIVAEVFDEEENDDIFGIDLPGVSLESLPYGPFEFAYFLENGFGLKVAEPNLAYDHVLLAYDHVLDTSRSSLGQEIPSDDSCDDPDNKEWHLKHIKAPEAWDFSDQEGKPSRGEGVVIAQIDTGYSDHYGAFTDDIWINASTKGFNMFSGENESDPKDKLTSVGLSPGHGTLVAPHAVGRGDVEMRGVNGGKSPKGTAPKAKLYSIRAVNNPVIDPRDVGRINDAFEDIVKKNINVDVISLSLGTPSLGFRHWRVKSLIKQAIDKNIIVIAAGGQSVGQLPPVVYPARFDNVIAVGGYQIADTSEGGPLFHERNMEWWSSAHAGRTLDIAGPANDVCNAKIKTNGDHAYGEGVGTSLATAMSGGIAALWLAHHGKGNLIQHFKKDRITLQVAFKKVLELAANKNGWEDGGYNRRYGHGMIDAEAILRTPLNDITSAVNSRSLFRQALEEESNETAAYKDMMDLLLETGYDEDTLKLFQGGEDLEHFVSELIYIKSNNDAVMSSVLRAKLGKD